MLSTEGLQQTQLLKTAQAAEHFKFIHEAQLHVASLLGRHLEDFLECLAVEGPDLGGCLGLDGGRTGGVVHQSQLAKGHAGVVGEDQLAVLALVLGLLARDAHETLAHTILQYVPVVAVVTLFDDEFPLLQVFGLHGVDNDTRLFLGQVAEEHVLADSREDDLLVLGSLGNHRRHEVGVVLQTLTHHIRSSVSGVNALRFG
mmetsp:Transcript_4874/g.11301  ORF Transcript_4874/g.11301 Transcript_4874/m.11301 type:complete len:201 (-) Transcript_4874:607-1209(-)